MTGCCTAAWPQHDYSHPPHNTPDNPRLSDDGSGGCQARSAAAPFGRCQHQSAYELVIYQIASHDWIRMVACVPCTATLRERHARLGPGGSQGIARIRLYEPDPGHAE
jgi:hypothetical protein